MRTANDWDDVEDIFFDGTKEELINLRCPDCSGKLQYSYSAETGSYEMRCSNCGTVTRAYGASYTPNCVKYFGNTYDWS